MVNWTVPEGRIGGWKEIARHLGVDQRTAQRWELSDGLPVLREGGKVFAYAGELDRWRSARVVGPAVENPGPIETGAVETGAIETGATETGAVENGQAIKAAPARGPAATRAGSKRLAGFSALGMAGFMALGAWAWNVWPREAQVLDCTQLTRDGRPKSGPLFTDGRRIFFMELIGRKARVVSVAVGGGDVTVWDLPMESPQVTGISASRGSLLIEEFSTHRLFEWKPEPHSLREIPVPGGLINYTVEPSGRRFAASGSNGVTIFEPGSHVPPLKLRLPGRADRPSWDAAGQRLWMPVMDDKAGTSSWFEYSVTDPTPHLLPHLSHRPIESNGSWTWDGRFFLFQAAATFQSQIWVSDGGTAHSRRSYPLTNDARVWLTPVAAPSGAYTVFAVGEQSQGKLVSLPPSGSGAERVLPAVSGYEIDYSRDGSAMAYTRFPDHTIWRAKPDGSDLRQLSPAGIEAHQPHWSPDGTRIAFMGKRAGPDARWRIYIVPSPGGVLDQPLPHGDDQGVPTWSGDGHSLIFGDLKLPAGFEHAAIHELDLRTFALSTIPAPVGLWSPRMSPDGRYLAAVSHDNQFLYLRDNRSGTWRKRATFPLLEEPVWSRDSVWIQFVVRPGAGRAALFRIDAAQGPAREIVDISTFEPAGATWFGIGPDGAPLGLRGISAEIYSLNWRIRMSHL